MCRTHTQHPNADSHIQLTCSVVCAEDVVRDGARPCDAQDVTRAQDDGVSAVGVGSGLASQLPVD